MAGDIRFQVVDVSALLYKMRRPDADQPLEHSATQRCSAISDILEFFAITSFLNVVKTSEKTVHIMTTQQLADRNHINLFP